ncbi:MAG: 1-deoxy-D-xylulose-5-phosphate reductoisomerase [Alphaproteobacteria bacterium]|nr:1-deoxy-D-xylulose-5-phosphate reductoisomerase [Alphaproteobacteria bacterium]
MIQPKRVSILGSTGSIGQHSLHLIKQHPELFAVECLTAHRNVDLLAKQAIEFNAKHAVIADEGLFADLKSALFGTSIHVSAGLNAIDDAASIPAEVVVAGIVGAVGLKPTMTAIKQGTTIAFANKECLVCAGDIMLDAVKHHNATLIPVDSEHSAIFQVFDTTDPQSVEKIILTASGGPLLNYPLEALSMVKPEQALNHPTWNMGAKISIDSATMMNKGLEIIEAHYLFPVRLDQIDVLIHPESIIHSMVQYQDGSVLAQLGTPDMCTPLSYALHYPQRLAVKSKRLDLVQLKTLSFFEPDLSRFPALTLARQALTAGLHATIMLNSANEVAVDLYLNNKIRFTDITLLIESCLQVLPSDGTISTIDDVIHYNELCNITALEIAHSGTFTY